MWNTAINGILNPSLSFIGERDSGLAPVTHRNLSEELRHVASSKHLMNSSEVARTVFVGEIRCENTAFYTFSSQEFAGTTRWTGSRHRSIPSRSRFFDWIILEGIFFWVCYTIRCWIIGLITPLFINSKGLRKMIIFYCLFYYKWFPYWATVFIIFQIFNLWRMLS